MYFAGNAVVVIQRNNTTLAERRAEPSELLTGRKNGDPGEGGRIFPRTHLCPPMKRFAIIASVVLSAGQLQQHFHRKSS